MVKLFLYTYLAGEDLGMQHIILEMITIFMPYSHTFKLSSTGKKLSCNLLTLKMSTPKAHPVLGLCSRQPLTHCLSKL